MSLKNEMSQNENSKAFKAVENKNKIDMWGKDETNSYISNAEEIFLKESDYKKCKCKKEIRIDGKCNDKERTENEEDADKPEETKSDLEKDNFSSRTKGSRASEPSSPSDSETDSGEDSDDSSASAKRPLPANLPVFKPRARMYRAPAAQAAPSQYIMDVPEMWAVGADGSMMEAFNKFEIKD